MGMFDEAKPQNLMKGRLRSRTLAGLVFTFCLLAIDQFEAKAQSSRASGNATVKSDSSGTWPNRGD